MKKVFIEICKSNFKERYKIRIGNITEASEYSNISYEELLKKIKDAILNLKEQKE